MNIERQKNDSFMTSICIFAKNKPMNMTLNQPKITSKLPNVGTTIFTLMSKLASDVGAINLSQGFPDFEASPELISLLSHYTKKGFNQYAPMSGVQVLRETVAEKTAFLYGVNYDSEHEVTIVSGATEALFAAIMTVVEKGDEVIVFEPAYDSYVPAIELNGGIPIFVTLTPDDNYQINWQEVRAKISDKTKLIIINTPHNPIGRVLSSEDLNKLTAIVENTNIFLVADEVYEHIIFDGFQHHSLCTHPILKERTFICNSFGKTFHVTGWKMGYCLAPKALSMEFRKIHQFLTFSSFTPVQYALADFMKNPENYLSVPSFYERKRNLFNEAIKEAGFDFTPTQGSFFQTVSYKNLSDEYDFDLAIRLTKEIGVASIPVSVFYNDRNDYKILRFCFAKNDETLLKAADKLVGIKW
jgi:methionine transaminase